MDRYLEMAAAIPDIGGSIQSSLDSAGGFVVAHQDAATVITVVVLSVAAMLLALRFIAKKPINEAEEMRKRLILDQKYADMIGDGLFEMLCNDEIDRHEYKRACRRFGIAYRLGDLLTRKNPKRGLKHRVIHHCNEIHRTPSIAGKIPGPKPGEDVPASFLVLKPVPTKRKVWVIAGKALLRRKSAN